MTWAVIIELILGILRIPQVEAIVVWFLDKLFRKTIKDMPAPTATMDPEKAIKDFFQRARSHLRRTAIVRRSILNAAEKFALKRAAEIWSKAQTGGTLTLMTSGEIAEFETLGSRLENELLSA